MHASLKHLDSVTTNEESSQDNKINFKKLVGNYIDHAHEFSHTIIIQSAHEFREDYSSVMISLLMFVNHCLIDTDKHVFST
jgi:hypothetical protein